MITSERVEQFANTLAEAFEKLPALVREVGATAEDRERLLKVVEDNERVVDQLNLTIADLRERVAGLDARVHELLTQNAKLERLIITAGEALRGSDSFMDAAASLAASKPAQVNGLDS